MNNATVTYRGAKAPLSEVAGERTVHQDPCTVSYRGATGKVSLAPHKAHRQKVTYRGATAELEV